MAMQSYLDHLAALERRDKEAAKRQATQKKYEEKQIVMNSTQKDFLRCAAQKYIWWKTPDEAVIYPQRVLAQVMNIGIWEDLCKLSQNFNKEELLDVLQNAEAGQFNSRSWHFWHYRLTDCAVGEVPALPVRRFDQ